MTHRQIEIPENSYMSGGRDGVTVIMGNIKNFEVIQKFCNVRVMSSGEYFENKY
jgi:hypothetical protein